MSLKFANEHPPGPPLSSPSFYEIEKLMVYQRASIQSLLLDHLIMEYCERGRRDYIIPATSHVEYERHVGFIQNEGHKW